ncbi:phosphoesterase RecJ domain protein [Isosphaera pallida ATCC 43644]|uniref:Phosphoesterase RecJ domain protein n=1 Tax=Isosphaera pallida (strain ATCC 43644 / DSM 9630 / IS1B) TaxID=575540 RepID=E8R3A6_ISOPI|nr:DHH family phosphoesterase [Isosphaera pallida]ADV63616.1 phosphoesterase RecJ domain protein [Isosphaera pallida ATCC 43644]
MTNIDWQPLEQFLQGANRFVVASHVRPDGDALGSSVGLAEWLDGRGQTSLVVSPSPVPPRYDFLATPGRIGHFGIDITSEHLNTYDALIILDLSSWSQLGALSEWVHSFAGPRLVIDHHVSQDEMNAVVLKDTRAESTGTLVLDAIRRLDGLEAINPVVARALATAILMDTGWLAHPNMTASTLTDLADLVKRGADLAEIHRLLFQRGTVGRVRLLGEAMARVRLEAEGRLAWSAVSFADFARLEALPADTEDLINHLMSIDSVQLALLFVEQRDGSVKCSFRSRKLNCAKLAGDFGGGGHRAAAGATLEGPMAVAIQQVRAAALELLDHALKADPT